MIVKIKSRKTPSFKQLLEYISREQTLYRNRRNNSFVIKRHLKGQDINSWVQEFQKNESTRIRKRKNGVILTHEILSFSPLDKKKITSAKLKKIAKEYIRLRNKNGMCIAIPHFDKDHFHIHFCFSGIEYKSGKTMRISKKEFTTLKKNIQQFQREKFPELSNSIVNFDKKQKKVTDREYQVLHKGERTSLKKDLQIAIEKSYSNAKSMEDFLDLISKRGAKPYLRRGVTTGVWFRGYKFRFNRIGLDKDRLNELNRRIERSKELRSNRRGKEIKGRELPARHS